MDPNAFLHIEDVESLTGIAKNVLTAAAIAVGGIWAYWRFLRERIRWPRAVLKLSFTDRVLDESTVLLSVRLGVHNEGLGLMRLTELRFDLSRVTPLDAKTRARITAGCVYGTDSLEADWPPIESRELKWPKGKRPELEPGEPETFSCDFFLDRTDQTVYVYAYLHNVRKGRLRKHQLGWTASDFHRVSVAERPIESASLTPVD